MWQKKKIAMTHQKACHNTATGTVRTVCVVKHVITLQPVLLYVVCVVKDILDLRRRGFFQTAALTTSALAS